MNAAVGNESRQLWRAVERIEERSEKLDARLDTLESTMKRGNVGTILAALVPSILWAIVSLAAQLGGHPPPPIPIPAAHAAPMHS
jgi:hypothetical protein